MFSSNVKRFDIRFLLFGLTVLSVGMGFLFSGSYSLFTLGLLLLVGSVGFVFAYSCFFVSDVIDDRPVSDRKWTARLPNLFGLLVVVMTTLASFVLLIVFLIQAVYWSLNDFLFID